MTVAELLEKLKDIPLEAKVMVEHSLTYNDCRSVQLYAPKDTRVWEAEEDRPMVFLSDEEE